MNHLFIGDEVRLLTPKGEITVPDSGVMILSDPCYTLGTWCQAEVSNLLPGKYKVFVSYLHDVNWGTRISGIVAAHEDFWDAIYCSRAKLTESKTFSLGVDSGQLGIFDKEWYRNDAKLSPEQLPKTETWKEEDEMWYGTCCEATLDEEQCGLVPGGFVSSSGYGDGAYDAFLHQFDGCNKYAAIEVVFIDDDEDEEKENVDNE